MTQDAGTRAVWGAGILAAGAVFLALFLGKGIFDEPPAVSVPVKAGSFDAGRAVERLARILGDERPHPVDSDANDLVRTRLIAEIEALGYAPEVRDDFACRGSERWRGVSCARVRNVLFRAGPEGGNAVLVAAHYDSVAAGPGAADDGIGMATMLEIASLIKGRTRARPVIFLVTDGEEDGLIGAASFVRKDPVASQISAVINLEARGVTGKALMFETSNPNGRAAAAYARVPNPSANSFATAIYKLLPNNTDLSEFEALGADALNFAIIGGPAHYHTPGDNLANLDRRSVAHMGQSALASLEGFLDQPADASNTDVAFTDIFGQVMLIFPVFAGLAILGLSVLAAGAVFIFAGGGAWLRALLVPVASAVIAGVLGWVAIECIKLVRGEDEFWFAHPWATQGVVYAAAVTGVLAGLVLVGQGATREQLIASAWLWLAVIGLAISVAIPGAAGLFAPPLALFLPLAAAFFLAPRFFPAAAGVAALAVLIFLAPFLSSAEGALSLGFGAAFAVFGAYLAMLLMSPLVTQARMRMAALAIPASLLIVFFIAALGVPAYSPAAPQPLNIIHSTGAATGTSHWVLSGKPASSWGKALAPFKSGPVPGYTEAVLAAPAPPHDGRAPRIEIVETVTESDGKRRLKLRVHGEGANIVQAVVPEAAGVVTVKAGGQEIKLTEPGPASLRCTGRACAQFEMEVVVAAAPADWSVASSWYGLDVSGQALLAARPPSATPVQFGDRRRVWVKQKI